MKSGDEVTIFQDPLTSKVVEGQAIVVKKVGTSGELERWAVRFCGEDSDGKVYNRFILPKAVVS